MPVIRLVRTTHWLCSQWTKHKNNDRYVDWPASRLTGRFCPPVVTYITPDLQCARGRGFYDVCYGDSGGPIVVKPTDDSLRTLSNGRDVLVGVVNWAGSLGCRLMTRPTYYNRVASAFSWIVSVAPEILDTTFGLII